MNMLSKKIKLFYENEKSSYNLGVYMCDTNLKSKVAIIPITNKEDGISKVYAIKSLAKVAYPYVTLEVNRKNIKSVLRLKGKVVKLTYEEYVLLSNVLLHRLTRKIWNTYTGYQQNRLNSPEKKYILTENYYKFLAWFEHKSNLIL